MGHSGTPLQTSWSGTYWKGQLQKHSELQMYPGQNLLWILYCTALFVFRCLPPHLALQKSFTQGQTEGMCSYRAMLGLFILSDKLESGCMCALEGSGWSVLEILLFVCRRDAAIDCCAVCCLDGGGSCLLREWGPGDEGGEEREEK